MKHLIFLILLAFAIPARSQEQPNGNPNDQRPSKTHVHYLNPQDPDDHRRIRTTDIDKDYFRTYHRRKLVPNIVGAGAGVALLTYGIFILNTSPPNVVTTPGAMATLWGGLTTLICGGSLASNLVSLHRQHYSIVIYPTGVGLAYNF